MRLAFHLPNYGAPDTPIPFGRAGEDDHLTIASCRRERSPESGEPAGIGVAECVVDDHRNPRVRRRRVDDGRARQPCQDAELLSRSRR